MQTVAIIDIGKTRLKVAPVDMLQRAKMVVETRTFTVIPDPPWPHFNVARQWAFITEALRRVAAVAWIEGIVVTTHGACAALLGRDGGLAAPVLDCEHPGPDALRAGYGALHPAFAETGRPVLPIGLNLGAQLHWMLAEVPGLRDRVAHVVIRPQYRGYRLTGAVASGVPSLGVLADLWVPHQRTWSPLVDRLGLTGRMAPARQPGKVPWGVASGGAGRTGPWTDPRSGGHP